VILYLSQAPSCIIKAGRLGFHVQLHVQTVVVFAIHSKLCALRWGLAVCNVVQIYLSRLHGVTGDVKQMM
jgi:hypothetical protein